MKKGLTVAAVLVLASATPALTASPVSAWPCAQRLVPTLAPASYWPVALPANATEWRANAPLAAVVAKAAARETPVQDGLQLISGFLAGVAPEERGDAAARLFAGLVETVNAERATVIARIQALTLRQQELAAAASASGEELRALPQDADPAKREEITERRGFLIRQFEDLARTTRYACEVPVQLEARLGAYARPLQEQTAR